MINLKNATVSTQMDVVIVGQDSEFADYDNPRGHLFGDCHAVIVTLEDGTRYQHKKTYTAKTRSERHAVAAAAEAYAASVQKYINKGGKLDMDCWTEIQAAYGSDAYVRNGCEQDLIEWEREQERFDDCSGGRWW